MEVQALILAGIAVLLLFGGINGFRKGVVSVAPGITFPHPKNALVFKRVVFLQVILGGLALAGAIVLHLNKTPGQVADGPEDNGPQKQGKRSLAAKIRGPDARNTLRGSKDDMWRKSLVGTWRLPLEDYGTGEITYSSNGGMSGRITLNTAGKKEELIWSGKWDVKDGRICEEIEESNTPGVLPVGRKTKDRIIEVKEKEFRIFDAEIDETTTLPRIE